MGTLHRHTLDHAISSLVPTFFSITVITPAGLTWPSVSVSSPETLSESENYVFQDLLTPDSVIMLTLQEAVMQALEHNLVRSVERPEIFDLLSLNIKLGLQQKLLPEGSYDLNLDTNRNAVAGTIRFLFHPFYSSKLKFNLTYPLLRHFGRTINSVQITLAPNTAAGDHFTLVNQIISVIAQVEPTDWNWSLSLKI